MDILMNKGRNPSHVDQLNFLCKKGNVYVMDNHLAAFWCWAKELNVIEERYNLLHIDRHNDTSDALVRRGFHLYKSIDFSTMTLDEALDLKVNDLPMMQWDNFIELFNVFYPYAIRDIEFITPEKLDFKYRHYSPSQKKMKNWLERTNSYHYQLHKADILNLDIDVFFKEHRRKYVRNITEEEIGKLASLLIPVTKMAKVVTIALSPECCGGWQPSIEMFDVIDAALNLQIGKLPL